MFSTGIVWNKTDYLIKIILRCLLNNSSRINDLLLVVSFSLVLYNCITILHDWECLPSHIIMYSTVTRNLDWNWKSLMCHYFKFYKSFMSLLRDVSFLFFFCCFISFTVSITAYLVTFQRQLKVIDNIHPRVHQQCAKQYQCIEVSVRFLPLPFDTFVRLCRSSTDVPRRRTEGHTRAYWNWLLIRYKIYAFHLLSSLLCIRVLEF